MIGTPAGIPPARLFRLLLQRPRPIAPLAYRIRGAEDVPLRVRAISGLDEAAIADAAEAWGEAGPSRAAAEIVSRALLAPDGPAFASADDVGGLQAAESIELARAVRAALDVVSPTYVRHDWKAWEAVLKKGAKSPGNWAETLALGGCVDFALGFNTGRVVERPDRYFGIPLADMTDGQWMVYRAAREVTQELQKK